MTDLTAYRHRVTTVRGRARAQLAAIRKERLSRRKQVRYVAEAASPVAPTAAEAVVPQDAPMEAAGEPLAKAEPTSGLADVATGHGPSEPVSDEAACEALRNTIADSIETDTSRHAERDEAAPIDPATDAGTATDAATAHDAEPLQAVASSVEAPVAEERKDGNAASAHADEPVTVEASLPRDTAPEDEGGADAAETRLPEDTGALVLAAAAETSAHEIAEASKATDPQPEPVPTDAEPDRAVPSDPRPGEPAPDVARAMPREVVPAVVKDKSPAPASQPEDCVAQSDLFQIPGIGTGLVWMMQSAGIQCLDDLARAETRELEERLGMISRLLDLDYFVEFARARDARP